MQLNILLNIKVGQCQKWNFFLPPDLLCFCPFPVLIRVLTEHWLLFDSFKQTIFFLILMLEFLVLKWMQSSYLEIHEKWELRD